MTAFGSAQPRRDPRYSADSHGTDVLVLLGEAALGPKEGTFTEGTFTGAAGAHTNTTRALSLSLSNSLVESRAEPLLVEARNWGKRAPNRACGRERTRKAVVSGFPSLSRTSDDEEYFE